MNGIMRRSRRRAGLVAAGSLLLAGLVLLPSGSTAAAQARQGRRPPSKVKVGEYPPDFALPYLTLERDAGGKPVGRISEKTFRLSSYRGKRPVCMFMSSYT